MTGSWSARPVALALTVATVVAGTVLSAPVAAADTSRPEGLVSTASTVLDAPVLGAWQATVPAGPVGDYAFTNLMVGDVPINWPRFDPCSPIEWGIDDASFGTVPPAAVAEFHALVQDVFDELDARSPYSFVQIPVAAGAASATAIRQTVESMPGQQIFLTAGDDPAAPGAVPGYDTARFTSTQYTEIGGFGGPLHVEGDAGGQLTWITAGSATIKRGQIARATSDQIVAAQRLRNTIAHEVGHALGLGHTPNTSQLMSSYSTDESTSTFQAGDLAGLAALAGLGCRAG